MRYLYTAAFGCLGAFIAGLLTGFDPWTVGVWGVALGLFYLYQSRPIR
jgi:hypothetical protein